MSFFSRIGRRISPRASDSFEEATFVVPDTLPEARDVAEQSHLPRFHGRASDDLSLTQAGTNRSIRSRLRLAFTPSQPVSDMRMFAGRHQMLLDVIRAIEDQQMHVVLYGDRGMGKTSLLRMLINLARDARYVVDYVSCSETSDFDTTFRSVAANLPIMYHIDYGPTSPEAERGATLAEILPTRPLGVAEVSDLFAKISGTRVLVVLDEYDRSISGDFHRSIAELIKTLSDRSARVQLIIAGVAPDLTALIEHIPSIRRNVLGIAVGKLTEAELGQLLDNGEKVGGLGFAADARAAIIYASNGSPYLAGLLGQQAGIAASDGDRVTVGLDDVRAALDRAVAEVEQRVSPGMLRALRAAIDSSGAGPLLTLASQSLDHCGRITQAFPVGADYASFGGLLEEVSASPGGYRFVEDSVPLLVWLQEVRRALAAPNQV